MMFCKIKLPQEGFKKYEHDFCGVPSYLIIPEIDAKWNKHNLFYRSLIVSKENNEVLSSGFPKFFNYGEKPECYPNPESYKDWNIQEKLDGSLVICDYINGKFSMRTRGTASYITQPNFKDFELLLEKHPLIEDFLKQNQHLSLLLEIVTPNNVIVIRPSDIEFYLLSAINKVPLQVVFKKNIDEISKKINIPQPKIYNFDNLTNTVEIVKKWKGKEGIVISYNEDKNRVKIKSDWYCWIHKIKSQLNSEDNLIEFYVDENLPNYKKFYETIERNFDWELAEQMKGPISRLCDAGERVFQIVEKMKDFIKTVKTYPSRKEQADLIISSYGITNRSSFCFSLLDGKELEKSQLTKLMHQVLKDL